MGKKSPTPLIDVAQLMQEPAGSSWSYDLDEIINVEVEGSVKGKIRLTRTNRGVLLQGKLAAEVKLVCSRCLDTFLCPISFTAEEEFRPAGSISRGLLSCSAEELEEFTIDDNNMLDLGELIRQYVLLNLPMKPLCRADCPGMKETNSYGTGT